MCFVSKWYSFDLFNKIFCSTYVYLTWKTGKLAVLIYVVIISEHDKRNNFNFFMNKASSMLWKIFAIPSGRAIFSIFYYKHRSAMKLFSSKEKVFFMNFLRKNISHIEF